MLSTLLICTLALFMPSYNAEIGPVTATRTEACVECSIDCFGLFDKDEDMLECMEVCMGETCDGDNAVCCDCSVACYDLWDNEEEMRDCMKICMNPDTGTGTGTGRDDKQQMKQRMERLRHH